MLTKQDMFDRAVRGLRAQGWRRSFNPEVSRCSYKAPDGKRCAWGHVDPSLDDVSGTVYDLRKLQIGLAAGLDDPALRFATLLQQCHDGAICPEYMEERFRQVAKEHALTWPEEEAPNAV